MPLGGRGARDSASARRDYTAIGALIAGCGS
jgi:hypothetical protein